MTDRPELPETAAAPRLRARAGISLVATMVAIFLLGSGAMALAAANASSLRSRTTAGSRGTALAIARTHIEELRAGDPWTLASSTAIPVDGDGIPRSDGRYSRRVTVTEVRSNLVRIDVAVTGPGVNAPLTVSTNVYRGGTLHRR